MNTLTLGYIAKTQVNALFMESLYTAIPLLKEHLEYQVSVKSLLGKSNLPHARSILVTEWYDTAKPGDLFFFIDTDQTFTHAELIKVIRQKGDLRAGIYANRAGKPTSIAEGGVFQSDVNAPLRYAGTGFLCFTYEAVDEIRKYIKNKEGFDRVVITDNHPREGSVIPFFQPLLIGTNSKTYWLGEDFSFSYRAKAVGLTIVGTIMSGLGHELSTVVYYKGKPTVQWAPDTVVYYCGNSHVEFSPLDTKLGGAEQAVVYLSAALQKQGKQVTVYGRVKPANHNGVIYRPQEEFNANDTFDTLILWRAFGLQILPYIKEAKTLLVDLHDPTDSRYLPLNMMERVTSIMVKSDYHRSLYQHLPDSKFTILPNGMQTIPPTMREQRDLTRFCYTSSYERGLVPILKYMWPKIKAAIPTATFHIRYGNDRLNSALLAELTPLLQQAGVIEHGRSTYKETLQERAQSVAQLYLSSTPAEIDCLSIREAAALGCIPIISHYAVFTERAGIHVKGDPEKQETQLAAADIAINISRMPEQRRAQLIQTLKKDALTTTWDEVATQWLSVDNSKSIETKIVVFVPYCDYFEEFIIRTLQSIVDQNYNDYEVVIVNDGSTKTQHIEAYIQNKPSFTLLNFGIQGGPAASKWRFLNYLQQNLNRYGMNDICMIVDGDDYLTTKEAFTIINKTYQENKCWVTYGNCVGNFCKRSTNVIPNTWTNLRSSEFIYNHPRTFKLALATRFEEEDFKIYGEWLTKHTDSPIIYNTIEWAGKARTKFIDSILYNYVEHDNNSYKLVSAADNARQKAYVTSLSPKEVITEDIHIVMCLWKRPENLAQQVENLNNQTVATRIHLHLLNNNSANRERFEELVSTLIRIYTNIRVTLTHYNNEHCAFERFIYTRDILLKSFNIDYVIFMDDDQLFESTWVEDLYKSRKPKTYIAWYCKKWAGNIDYWNGSIVSITDCKMGIKVDISDNMHYGATCGAIIDTSIFISNSLLFKVPEDLPKGLSLYNGIEDLWLSFIIRKVYRWRIERTSYREAITLNTEGSNSESVSLYLGLHAEKQRLLEYLVGKYGL